MTIRVNSYGNGHRRRRRTRIGVSLARAFARQGYALALLSRGAETSTRVAEEIRVGNGKALVVQTDISRAGLAPLAIAKASLRMLGQSLAREFHPKGIHVVHLIVDGQIDNPETSRPGPERRQ